MSTLAAAARFNDYTPADFGWGGDNDPEAHPNLLVPFTHSGVSFGSMHSAVVGLFTTLLDELVPHIDGGLAAGTCGCYNPGSVTVGGDRSFHTYGIAIDVNWSANPMYAKQRPTGPHTLPPVTSGIARAHGCEWGGDWTYPQDWMHIECHLTPTVARTVTPAPPAPAAPPPQEDDMARIITIDPKDCAPARKGAPRWPGYFLANGYTLRHISTAAELAALRRLGITAQYVTLADYKALGGK